MTYSLKNRAILSTKGATFRCVLMDISKKKGWKRLNNSVTEVIERSVANMDFNPNKTPIEIINGSISLIKVVLYNFFYFFFFVIYKNGWEHWFNSLSKKQRFDTK